MDNTRHTQKNHIPIIAIIFLFILVVVFAYDYLRLAALVSLGLFITILFGYGLIWLASAWQELQKKADERYKNNLFVAPKDSQVIAIERRGKEIYHKKVHLAQNVYSNGKYQEPTPTEQRGFELFHGKRIAANKKQPLLIEGESTETRQRTIFDVVDNGVHFSLIGSTNSGKSTLANHIVDYLEFNKTYALDPHAKFNEWSHNCKIIQSYPDIAYAIEQAFIEMSSRYDKGPGNYQSILLCIDEFVSVMEEHPECEKWIARIAREGRKVNVALLLMSQTDQINEIGFTVATRRNFTKIELVPELTKQNLATIKHWDKTIETVTLAGPYEKQLSFEEQVIDLWEKSDKTRATNGALTQITKRMCNGYGGAQRNKITAIIDDYEKGLVNENN